MHENPGKNSSVDAVGAQVVPTQWSLVYFVSRWFESFDYKCVLVLYFHNFTFPRMLVIQSWMYTLQGEVIAPISSII